MALTMTRTRTQKALNKLAGMVADIHGELESVELCLSPVESADEAARAALEARRAKLRTDLDALYVTLRQFDPDIDPSHIGAANSWQKAYSKGGVKRRLGAKTLKAKYLAVI